MGILDRFSLQGRVALVSGGSGPQFGSSLSEGLAEAGATVISASRSLERNEEFAERLRGEGHDAHAMQLDITDPASISALGGEVLDRFGRIDVLVNSAVVGRGGGFEDQTYEYWQYSASGNMSGLFAMCKTFVPAMVEQGRGSIVNISSIYGVVGNDPTLYEGTEMKQAPDYNFVKAGMINFTRYVANYYGKQGCGPTASVRGDTSTISRGRSSRTTKSAPRSDACCTTTTSRAQWCSSPRTPRSTSPAPR